MLMTIQVQVKLVLLQQWQVVSNDVGEVWVPFAPHGVVQSSSLPNNRVILLPLLHGLVDPLVLLVALDSHAWVTTLDISQAVVLWVEVQQAHVATSVTRV